MNRVSLEEARERLLNAVSPLTQRETVPLSAAPGRVLAGPAAARLDVPPFDRSPLDGWALRAADTAGALASRPARIPLDRTAPVATGEALPPWADCVVMAEEARPEGRTLLVFRALAPGQNYISRGEDMREGELLFPPGTRLDWTCLPALAAQGIACLEVLRRPRAAVLSTGRELSPQGVALSPGTVYDVNTPALSARLAALGVEALPLPPAPDQPRALAERMAGALNRSDMLILTGGVSVGETDGVPAAAELLNARLLFRGVNVRPGGPAAAFTVEGKPVLALSGNPFAALALFETVGRPALDRLAGDSHPGPRRLTLPLGKPMPLSTVRRLLRGSVSPEGRAVPAPGNAASGAVFSLAGCGCLIDRPAGPALAAEDAVDVWLF